jgi:hypothetical protein
MQSNDATAAFAHPTICESAKQNGRAAFPLPGRR